MKLAVLTKSKYEEGQRKKEELTAFLTEQRISFICIETFDCENLESPKVQEFIEGLKECDALIAFGGDGTVLRAVAISSTIDIPILSINLGAMGFLAELEKTATPQEILDAVNTFDVESRDLLEVCVGGSNKVVALNDVVLKALGTTPIYISAKIDGEALDRYRSDGVIVSTPTGSTAYALSAGGPILAPELDAMLIIPICPHTLHSKPVVLSIDSKVELLLERENESAEVIVDGRLVSTISGLSTLQIEKSKYTAQFLRNGKTGFYTRLLQKMNVWGVSNS